MNAELAAMNKISKAVETSTADLDEGAKGRVLGWFVDWTYAQIQSTDAAPKPPDSTD